MNARTALLGLFVLLTIVFASSTVYEAGIRPTLTSTSTLTSTATTELTSTATIAMTTTTSTSTVYTYSVPSNDVYVGLLGCSVSKDVCSLIVYSGYVSGNVTISQENGCVDLTYYPSAGVETGLSSSSCAVSPSPVLKYGKWASVNATFQFSSLEPIGEGPPPVGSEIHGTLLVEHGVGNDWAGVAFAGLATP